MCAPDDLTSARRAVESYLGRLHLAREPVDPTNELVTATWMTLQEAQAHGWPAQLLAVEPTWYVRKRRTANVTPSLIHPETRERLLRGPTPGWVHVLFVRFDTREVHLEEIAYTPVVGTA